MWRPVPFGCLAYPVPVVALIPLPLIGLLSSLPPIAVLVPLQGRSTPRQLQGRTVQGQPVQGSKDTTLQTYQKERWQSIKRMCVRIRASRSARSISTTLACHHSPSPNEGMPPSAESASARERNSLVRSREAYFAWMATIWELSDALLTVRMPAISAEGVALE
jgi:hypothetical protein